MNVRSRVPNRTQLPRLAVLTTLVLTAQACSEESPHAPEEAVAPAFDVAAVKADQEAVAGALATRGMTRFRAAAAHMADGGSFAATGGGGAPSATPVIPESTLGRTFAYDPARERYVPDPDRTAAPPNGVRFVLYAVDAATGRPDASRETGHADLLDLGDGDPVGPRLRFVVVDEGTTVLDYGMVARGDDMAGRVNIAGAMGSGTERLGFALGVLEREEGESSFSAVEFQMQMSTRQFGVLGEILNASDDSGSSEIVQLLARHGDLVINVTHFSTGTSIEGEVRSGIRKLATISGDPASPDIRSGPGLRLTGRETQALRQILGTQGQALRLLTDLLRPTGALLGLVIGS